MQITAEQRFNDCLSEKVSCRKETYQIHCKNEQKPKLHSLSRDSPTKFWNEARKFKANDAKCKTDNESLFKGGYLDFSHLTELKYIYITEIHMKKQYKSSRIEDHKITKKKKKE